MAKGTLNDPLVRQFLPLRQEQDSSRFQKNPLLEDRFSKQGRLLQKYRKRALLLSSSSCSMHCRFCFRRHHKMGNQSSSFDKELLWLEEHVDIEEVIFSGGDPLHLSDEKLAFLFQKIALIDHVKTIRIHTRFPIGIPERIDEDFLTLLRSVTKKLVFVLHVNHPKELDDDIKDKMSRLQNQGVTLLSQSVLLQGVNDSVEVLEDLCRALFDCSILPYYLHQLDQVEGIDHFEVPIEKGKSLIEELRTRVPGYLVPRYVQEIPFRSNKTSLM